MCVVGSTQQQQPFSAPLFFQPAPEPQITSIPQATPVAQVMPITQTAPMAQATPIQPTSQLFSANQTTQILSPNQPTQLLSPNQPTQLLSPNQPTHMTVVNTGFAPAQQQVVPQPSMLGSVNATQAGAGNGQMISSYTTVSLGGEQKQRESWQSSGARAQLVEGTSNDTVGISNTPTTATFNKVCLYTCFIMYKLVVLITRCHNSTQRSLSP